jgi:hypothetical protein
MVPVAAEKFRASPERVIVRLAFVVALARPERVKVPRAKAEPPLLRLTVWVEGASVLVSAVVVFAKNWMVLRLLLTGSPPIQVPWMFGPPVNQSRAPGGEAVTLEFAQVWEVCAVAEEIANSVEVAARRRRRVDFGFMVFLNEKFREENLVAGCGIFREGEILQMGFWNMRV